MVLFIFFSFIALVIVLVLSFAGAYLLGAVFGGDLAAWVQSLGAILAIVSGFAAAIWQVRAQRIETQTERLAVARAAHILAFEALETAGDRLENALTPSDPTKVMRLQGDRTTEMVLAMREFDTMKLPADLLPMFVRLRSQIYAINERVSEIYSSEDRNEERKNEREDRLNSAVRVYTDATELFEKFQSKASEFGAQGMIVKTGTEIARVRAKFHK